MFTYSQFPNADRPHLRTSNPIESPFAAPRLRTDAGERFKTVSNATAVIWKMLPVSQRRLQRVNAPELMQEAHQVAQDVNGLRVQELPWKVVA